MIRIYGLEVCPDCQNIKEQIKDRTSEFEYYDLAGSTALMKEFLKLRDENEVFAEAKRNNKIGIPYFVFEDGSVSLKPLDAGLKENERNVSCSLSDHLKGVKGC